MSFLPINYFTNNQELMFWSDILFDFIPNNDIIEKFQNIFSVLNEMTAITDISNPIYLDAINTLEYSLNDIPTIPHAVFNPLLPIKYFNTSSSNETSAESLRNSWEVFGNSNNTTYLLSKKRIRQGKRASEFEWQARNENQFGDEESSSVKDYEDFMDSNGRRKLFFIEKIPRGKYVRYDGILKRLKVYLFGKTFDEVLACCIKNHKKILTSVKVMFSFIREEFSINVSKHFNRLFLKERLFEIIEIIFYAKQYDKNIEESIVDELREQKNANFDCLLDLKKFSDFILLKQCKLCSFLLSKKYIDVVEDFKHDKPRFDDYMNDLKRQGYNNKYLNQFDELVSDFVMLEIFNYIYVLF